MELMHLRRFIELKELIAALREQQLEIKKKILLEFKEQEGEAEEGGIKYGVKLRTRTDTDLESMAFELGPELIAKYQSANVYPEVFVKPTSKALKGFSLDLSTPPKPEKN